MTSRLAPFSIRFCLRSVVLTPEAIIWKLSFFTEMVFINNFLIWEIREWKWHHHDRFVEPVWNMYLLTWKLNLKIWPHVRSVQGQIVTQVGQYAYPLKWLDEPSRLGPFARLPLRHVVTYWQKNGLWPHLTSGDLPVTFDRQLHPDLHRWGEWPWSWNNWVVSIGLCETEAFSYFPIDFLWGGHEIDLTLGHQGKNSGTHIL